jgi:hypothetical protein
MCYNCDLSSLVSRCSGDSHPPRIMRTLPKAVVMAGVLAALAAPSPTWSQSEASSAAGDRSGPGTQPQSAPDRIAAAQHAGMQVGTIRDPVMSMDAYAITYPAKWHAQGILSQGTACVPVPVAVFRFTSADGLSVIEHMPPFNWSWGPMSNSNNPAPGCLPIDQPVPAKDFLKQLSSMLLVEYLGEEPMPQDAFDAEARTNDQMNDMSVRRGFPNIHRGSDIGEANVRFKNGTYQMSGRLWTRIVCFFRGAPRNPRFESNSCSADVLYVYAPQERFQAVWDTHLHNVGAILLPDYDNAWEARLQRQTQQNITAMNQAFAQSSAIQQQQFQRQMAVQQQQHDQFMATLQHGTDVSMQHAAEIAQTNHTIASDYVDYSLGQQTMRDANTGQNYKVGAGAGVTWLNSSGGSYQSFDPNANPNGVLPGTWTRGQVVHGDGTP